MAHRGVPGPGLAARSRRYGTAGNPGRQVSGVPDTDKGHPEQGRWPRGPGPAARPGRRRESFRW